MVSSLVLMTCYCSHDPEECRKAVNVPGDVCIVGYGETDDAYRYEVTVYGVTPVYVTSAKLNPVHPHRLPTDYIVRAGEDAVEISSSLDGRAVILDIETDFTLLVEGNFKFDRSKGCKVIRCDVSGQRAFLLSPGDYQLMFAKDSR